MSCDFIHVQLENLQFAHHFHPFRFPNILCTGFLPCTVSWNPCTPYSRSIAGVPGNCHNVAVRSIIHYSSRTYCTIDHVHAMRKLQLNQPYLSWRILKSSYQAHSSLIRALVVPDGIGPVYLEVNIFRLGLCVRTGKWPLSYTRGRLRRLTNLLKFQQKHYGSSKMN